MKIRSIKSWMALLLSVLLTLNSTGFSVLAEELWSSGEESFVGFADLAAFDSEEALPDSPEAGTGTAQAEGFDENPWEEEDSFFSFTAEPVEDTALPDITVPFEEVPASEEDFSKEFGVDIFEEEGFDLEAADDALVAEELFSAEKPVTVIIEVFPADAAVTVKTVPEDVLVEAKVIPAQEDGSFLLVPGAYTYSVFAEGYTSLEEVPFTVEASEDPVTISLFLDTLVEMAGAAGFAQSVTVDGVVISVSAQEGVFPEGAVLQAEKAPAEQEPFLTAALEEARGKETKAASSYTFDIKVTDPETGEICQPAEGKTAEVTFALSEAGNQNLTPKVYHLREEEGLYLAEGVDILTDSRDSAEDFLVEGGAGAGLVRVEVSGFSFYTVEFTYGPLQYILEGDTAAALEEILSAVGLAGEVTAAEVSDPELVSVSKETGGWMVTALEAFTTKEWMKVTLDGVVFEIALTDAVNAENMSSWSALQTAIDKAQSGQVLRLTANINGSGRNHLNVQGKTVTIDLNGYTIDRKRTSSDSDGHVFWVRDKSTLTITDSRGGGIITGGYATNGGGINIDASSKCIINGGTISGNRASDGGGIYVRGTLEMNGGSLVNNEASSTGGAVYVADTGTMKLENVEIMLNKASDDGGAIRLHLKSDASINNSEITDNHSSDKGGAINMDAKGRTLTITDTKIEKNDSKDDGGAIYLHEGTIKMSGGTLSNNSSNNDSGGAKITSGTVFTAENVVMSGNKAISEEGGAIKNFGTTTLTGCTVRANNAKKQGGGIFNDNDSGKGTLTLVNTTVTANHSGSNGGGVYTDDTLIIKGGSFTKNSSDDRGGAIYVGGDANSTSIEGSLTVEDNGADQGNDIFLKSGRVLTLTGALGKNTKIGVAVEKDLGPAARDFVKYHAGEAASAYFFADKGLNVQVDDSSKDVVIFSLWNALQNELNAAVDGDVIRLTDTCGASSKDDRLQVKGKKSITLDLNGYTLNRNRTSSDGDGHVLEIFEGAALTIIDSSAKKTGAITGGYAENGGAINIHKDAAATLRGITVTQNKASYGGAVFVRGRLTLEEGTLFLNEASHTGGAIFVADTGSVDLTGSTLQENRSEDSGGAIEFKGRDSSITGCRILDNVSGAYAGALRMNSHGHTLTIKDTFFTGNASADDGGAIYLASGTMKLTGGEVSNNTSDNDGGGVKVTNNTAFTATGVTFDGNKASSEEGGAIKTYGNTTLEDCTVTNNLSNKQGGGIFNDDDGGIFNDYDGGHGTLTLIRTAIKDNHSASEAGGVYSDDRLEITGGDITGNTAQKRGGGLFVGKDSDYVKVSGDVIIQKNMAGTAGDNVFLREGTLLTIAGELGESAAIGIEKEDNNKAFTQGYAQYCEDADPSGFFTAVQGKGVALDEQGEAILTSGWPALRSSIKNATNNAKIVLEADYSASKTDDRLVVEGGKTITIDLAGHTLNRALTSSDEDGHVFEVKGNSTLILVDSVGGGKLTGGYASNGGAINIHSGSKCMADGIAFTGNKAKSSGGAICNRGSLELTDCTLTGNEAGSTGGAIFVDDSGTFTLEGVTITGNTAKDDGGALRIHLKSNASITNCTISNNSSGDKGGAINMDAKGKVLDITETKIENNRSSDDGGGIYLHNGTIEMRQGSLSGNTSNNDGGGAKITSKCTFNAFFVEIRNNTAVTEEGGAVKTYGSTSLLGCTVTGNRAEKEGGAVYSDNDGDSDGTLELVGSTFTDNHSGSNGGAVYSDDRLSINAGTFTENNAAGKGGGIFVGKGSDYAQIQGDIIVENNTASFGNNVFLREGQKLTLCSWIGYHGKIGVDLEKGTGTLTKDYGKYHKEDDPAWAFLVTGGYEAVFEEGEVQLKTSWKNLKETLEDQDTREVTLEADYAASSSDDRLIIPEGKEVVLDLNGHTLNRNRDDSDGDGHVIEVKGTLTLRDSASGGKLTGGWASRGGGINVNEGGTLIMEGGIIAGNKATDGGGIYVKGTATIQGGEIRENASTEASHSHGGGGIYVDGKGKLYLYGGEITKNTTAKYGSVYVGSSAGLTVHGGPRVQGNGNNEIYLAGNRVVNVDGALEGALLYLTTARETGTITSGYSAYNEGADPAAFFVSGAGYDVTMRGKEAQLSLHSDGSTEYADAFLNWKDQVNTNVNSLSGMNWMSGISGERYLYEINLPGTHDSGMCNPENFVLFDSSDWFSFFIPGVGSKFSKTQNRYINDQFEDGVRRIDLRLRHQYKTKTLGFSHFIDDGESLWICHGKVPGMGTYYAFDQDNKGLSLNTILEWAKDFLTKHPTETIIVSLTTESPDLSDRTVVFNRAARILTRFAREINPSTGESFVYRQKGSVRILERLSYIPQLKDCRGKIVFNLQGNTVDVSCGNFNADMSGIEQAGGLDYKLSKEEKVDEVREFYTALRAKYGNPMIPANVQSHLNLYWMAAINCTGQAHMGSYIIDFDSPEELSEYVNTHLFGSGKVYDAAKAGQYFGLVAMDGEKAEYSRQVWMTNFFPGLEYCTITVNSNLSDAGKYPVQTYQVLKGTRITVPGCIYKGTDGTFFRDWSAAAGGNTSTCESGSEYVVSADVTFSANWLPEDETPVQVVWKDAGNADGLRSGKLTLLASPVGTEEQTYTAEVTEEQSWKTVLSGNVYELVPQWDSVIVPTDGNPNGTDASGQYRYEAQLDGENGWVITLYHTPAAGTDITGTFTWEDDDNRDGVRPQSMTVRLLADGEETGLSTAVSGTGTYSFTGLPGYRNGEAIVYTVEAEGAGDYSALVDGTAVTGFYTPAAYTIPTFIHWEDQENALGLRPESVTIYARAEGENALPQTVNEADNSWCWVFDALPMNRRGGGQLTYTFTAEEVPSYTLTVSQHDDGCEFIYSLDKFSVTFEAGGEASGTMDSVSVDKGASYTLPEPGFTAPEGKSFKEWSVKMGEEETQVKKVGDVLTVTADTAVTAVWDAQVPSFRTHSLVLTGLIGINFYLNLPEIPGVDYSSSYMEFTVSGKGGKTTRDDFDPADRNASGEYYGFTCYVSSVQMADTITATFHYGEGESIAQTYSVARYIEAFAGVRDQYDEAAVNAVQSIADYGYFMQPVLAAANGWQIGADHAQMTPYTASLVSEESLSALRAAAADHAFDWNVENSRIEELTFDLTLDSATTLRIFLTPEEGYEGEVTAYLGDGTENVAVRQADGRYVITIPNISAHLLGQKYLVHGEAGGEYYALLSALTYIDAALDLPEYQNDTAMLNAMLALYNYYQAVMAYRGRH